MLSISRIQLGSKEISLSWIFKEIEANKDRLRIDNYSVFQTTLDQVRALIAAFRIINN